MAKVPPAESSTVGVVGRGFVSVLVAKLTALAGYNTWMLCPPDQESNILSLMNNEGAEAPPNLTLVPATDSDGIESNMMKTNALMIAVDDDSAMREDVLAYLLNPEFKSPLKRIVAMSRNLNGKGMGFLVKASKISANSEVWDNSKASEYKQFEEAIKRMSADLGAEYTFARCGTLKGGGCSEDEDSKYLSQTFYNMVKKDLVNWNLLHDTAVRGVKLSAGDVLPGPGGKAVFTATAAEAQPGDTNRASLAEAMVRSLAFEQTGNMDFGVACEDSREYVSDEEWEDLFSGLVKATA